MFGTNLYSVWESCPHFFMVASLWQPWNDAPAEKSQAQAMGGSTVSSLHRLRDDKNHGTSIVSQKTISKNL